MQPHNGSAAAPRDKDATAAARTPLQTSERRGAVDPTSPPSGDAPAAATADGAGAVLATLGQLRSANSLDAFLVPLALLALPLQDATPVPRRRAARANARLKSAASMPLSC